MSKPRCGAWNGNQCKATANLESVVVTASQGNFLKVPDKVVVKLCPKHFEILAYWKKP